MCSPRDEWVGSEHGTNARDVGRPFCNLIGFEIYDHARNVSIATRPLPHVMSGWGLGTRLTRLYLQHPEFILELASLNEGQK